MNNKVRRVVTGLNDQGASIILMDVQTAGTTALSPTMRASDIWATENAPADNNGCKDMGQREFAVPPLKTGTVYRYLEVDAGEGIEQPGWHATDTVDYIVIVRGEIYCLMDEGQVLLKAGDLLVQRGTNHAWVNRSAETCVMIGVMVSASPLK